MPTREKLPYKSQGAPPHGKEKNPDGPLNVPEAEKDQPATRTTHGAGMQHDPEIDAWNQGQDVVKRGKADQREPTPGEQSDDPHRAETGGRQPQRADGKGQPGGAFPGAAAVLPSTFGPYAPGGDFATLWAAVGGGSSTLNANAATIGRAAQATPATPTSLTVTAAADTALTASTEASDVLFDLSATKQFATGALTNQRAVRILGPTYSAVGASTITNAATVHISGAPVAGTNVTITNGAALWVQGGATFGSLTQPSGGTSVLIQPGQTTTACSALTVIPGAGTALTASTEAIDVNFNCNRTVQFATGALTLQRAVAVQAPTYGFVGASTLTQAATVAVNAAPTAGTNATITDAYALLVQAGRSGFGGQVVGNLSAFCWGTLAFTWPTDANQTLSASQCGNVFLNCSGGTLTGTRNLIVVNPTAAGGFYIVKNGTGGAQSIQIIGTSGTGITIATNKTAMVAWDGVNFVRLTADV